MPADLLTDAVRMVWCGLTVAAVAGPVGLVGYILARRSGIPVLPRPRPWRVPWTGFEVLVGFLILNAVIPGVVFSSLLQSSFFQEVYGPDFPPPVATPPFEASAAVAGAVAALMARDHQAELAAVRGLWVGILSLPLQIGLLVLARYGLYPTWRSPADPRAIPARLALGTVGWAVITPVVLAVHTAVTIVFARFDFLTEEHPLSKLSAARPVIDHLLFFLQAGVAAPLIEEVLFRGLLLGWLVGGRPLFHRPAIAFPNRPRVLADRRVWPVLVIGVGMAALTGRYPGELFAGPARGPVLFAAGLLVGWVVLRTVLRRNRRTAGAIYASAALFAVVHSGVWPSPIPLFVLGLGLGWLAVRTRGVLTPVVVHGLFNAVSVLFVLRGG
ncbi:MAG: amino terminal protease self-immunity [Gemmataceae bacterium]|nr:amino terminal protease self-immunity [Gemmataceae bacterium]